MCFSHHGFWKQRPVGPVKQASHAMPMLCAHGFTQAMGDLLVRLQVKTFVFFLNFCLLLFYLVVMYDRHL